MTKTLEGINSFNYLIKILETARQDQGERVYFSLGPGGFHLEGVGKGDDDWYIAPFTGETLDEFLARALEERTQAIK